MVVMVMMVVMMKMVMVMVMKKMTATVKRSSGPLCGDDQSTHDHWTVHTS